MKLSGQRNGVRSLDGSSVAERAGRAAVSVSVGHMRHRLVLSTVDLFLIGLATLSAQLLRDSFETRPEQIAALLPYLGLTLAAAIPALALFRLNQSIWRLSAMPDYLNVLGAAIITVAAAVGLGFLFNRLEGVARSLPVIQAYLMVFGLVGVRVLARLRHRGRGSSPAQAPISSAATENVLVVGINPITDLFLRSVAEYAADRTRVMGLLASKESQTGRLVQRHEILGSPDQIAQVLLDLEVHGAPVSRVVVTVPLAHLTAEARTALQEAEEGSGVRIEYFADYVCGSGQHANRLGAAPLPPREAGGSDTPRATFSRADGLVQRPYRRLKRALDLAAAFCAIVLLSPLLLLIAALVVVEIGAPAIFWQQRPGLGGRPFRLYKFRTMARPYDAEGRRIADADRLSVFGRFLRRSRLDELPQLVNILIGEMSFIGPRPLLAADQCPGLDARLAVRPGMTGWAQIKGGRQLAASDKAALDVWYIRNASPRIDLEILAGTLRVVLLGERNADAAAIDEAWRELRRAEAEEGWTTSVMPQSLPAQSSA
jgi:lipopolysaccharide/colanic/teichoic acid biosynthesis glycosyltransferase